MAIPILPIIEIGARLIDKLIPDKEAAAKAKLDLMLAQQQGELKELEVRMSAILAEAQSADPYTSRARPSMLYVFYLLIIAGLPMGLLAAFSPGTAADIATGFGSWLRAIPENITDMATFVMLGYIGGRSMEKIKGAA